MKTKFSALLVLSVIMAVSQVAYSQVETETLSSDVDAQIDQMNQPSQVVNQTVVVPQQQAVQRQPITVVEASPLSDSKSDNIRRNRQDEEMRTESRIVEKLEQSRLEDEKRRASLLFGDKFDSLQNGAPVEAAPQVIQAPAAQVQPQVIEANETLTRDAVREEVRAALEEDDNAVAPIVEQRYFSVLAGIGEYPDLQAIQGNYSVGAAFGSRYDYFLVEGAFVYSNYSILGATYVDYRNYFPIYGVADFDMDQYQGVISAKYQLLGGFVRPTFGGLVSYSYRQYTSAMMTSYGPQGTEFGTSHALDLGVIAGVDLEFNSKFSIGADMKYMFNMATRLDGDVSEWGTSPEKLEYYQMGVSARVNF